jgi:hypothetical protein
MIAGEERKTDGDTLVVWDLVLISANRYAWHRTDWPAPNRTVEIVRCRAGEPVEPP